ncbi:hypothetical protein DPEC_G00204930 [Dallia pectoralis]|uniref:Uncharacterized protein n=1 Tax=Dallia pectoralis TaxID=75939 RepID=A0ACC2G3X8_DALPE|nr:hypothetical protein DPEC_G00204930 [Dallia pectoralis]
MGGVEDVSDNTIGQLDEEWQRCVDPQIYNEKKSQFDIKRNNPKDLVERVARDIAKLLTGKKRALEVRPL